MQNILGSFLKALNILVTAHSSFYLASFVGAGSAASCALCLDSLQSK